MKATKRKEKIGIWQNVARKLGTHIFLLFTFLCIVFAAAITELLPQLPIEIKTNSTILEFLAIMVGLLVIGALGFLAAWIFFTTAKSDPAPVKEKKRKLLDISLALFTGMLAADLTFNGVHVGLNLESIPIMLAMMVKVMLAFSFVYVLQTTIEKTMDGKS